MPTKNFAQDMQIALDQEIAALRSQQSTSSPAYSPDRDGEQFRGGYTPETRVAGKLPPAAPQASASSGYAAAPGSVAAPPAPMRVMPDQGVIVANLGDRIQRLQQVRTWIGEDVALAHLIDTVIGQQVKTSEQRQARFSLILNIIFLIAGWLLSLFTGPGIAGMLHHI